MAEDQLDLDPGTLRRIRRLVDAVPTASGEKVPSPELVDLAVSLGDSTGLTIDFGAVAELGYPLVVLRTRSRRPAACLAGLSERERQVAELIGQGLSNKAIARELVISISTVKDHVHHILSKSGLPSRLALSVACRDEIQL